MLVGEGEGLGKCLGESFEPGGEAAAHLGEPQVDGW